MTLPAFFQANIPLASLCTLRVGGPAQYLVEAKTVSQMRETFAICSREKFPFVVLGKGSNCLFDDRGFAGVVILNKIGHFHERGSGIFEVGSGFSFARLGVITARAGWGGLEFAAGIPATVGGALFMNAGANGQETSQTVQSVQYLTKQGEIRDYDRDALPFSYRSSPFQKMVGAIIGATFQLTPSVEAHKQQRVLLRSRTQTQPYGKQSAGCLFRNPGGRAAGALIEQAGLKGVRIGGAEVSQKHGNFLINRGSARAEEIEELIELVKLKVYEMSGIELEEEVRRIPFQP